MNEHYRRLNPQTITRLQQMLSPEEFQGFCHGNVVKYAERAGFKDVPELEVLKLIDYANWWYESLAGKPVSYNLLEGE